VHSAPSNQGVVTGVAPCAGTVVAVFPDEFVCAVHNTVGNVVVGTSLVGGTAHDEDFYIEVYN
jgi:hypothetical protein